jgi:hypothetical protein
MALSSILEWTRCKSHHFQGTKSTSGSRHYISTVFRISSHQFLSRFVPLHLLVRTYTHKSPALIHSALINFLSLVRSCQRSVCVIARYTPATQLSTAKRELQKMRTTSSIIKHDRLADRDKIVPQRPSRCPLQVRGREPWKGR